MTPRTFACCTALALGSLGVACSGDGARPADAYCDKVSANVPAIETPAMATTAEMQATLTLYRDIADAAPVAVEPEWRTFVAMLETAATVIPSDAASVARMTDAALSGEPAYTQIKRYTATTCGTNLGGGPPPATNPVTATTIPDPDESAPDSSGDASG